MTDQIKKGHQESVFSIGEDHSLLSDCSTTHVAAAQATAVRTDPAGHVATLERHVALPVVADLTQVLQTNRSFAQKV